MSVTRDQIIEIACQGYVGSVEFDERSFKRDVHVFFTIRKMVRRFLTKGAISEKLLLNNIIICLNVFGIHIVNEILRLICTEDEFSIVIVFLNFLDCYIAQYGDPEGNQIIVDIVRDITDRYRLHPHQE